MGYVLINGKPVDQDDLPGGKIPPKPKPAPKPTPTPTPKPIFGIPGGTPGPNTLPAPVKLPPAVVGNGLWMNGGNQTLWGLLSGGQQASSKDLAGILGQAAIPGMYGNAPFNGNIPMGMDPRHQAMVIQSQLNRAMRQPATKWRA